MLFLIYLSDLSSSGSAILSGSCNKTEQVSAKSSPAVSYCSSEIVTNVITSVNSLLDLPFEGGNEGKEKIGLVEKILL